MTSNQIAYWKMMEEKRHNLALEYQNDLSIAEAKRHNLESELVGLKQAKASLASAAAAQANAAAAMKNAVIRGLELTEAERVNSANIARQDQLAIAQIREYSSIASLNDAKSSLTYVQAETEATRNGLLSVQTQLESERVKLTTAQMYNTWAGTVNSVVDTAGDIMSMLGLRTALKSQSIYELLGGK